MKTTKTKPTLLCIVLLILAMLCVAGCTKPEDPDNGGNGGGNNGGGETPEPGQVIDGPDLRTFTVNGVSFDMVKVEGGTFWMGAQSEDPNGQNYDENAYGSESPVHQVALSDYYISKYEVTQELWHAVMSTSPSHFQGDLLPVENVGPTAVRDFLFTLNARLEEEANGLTFRLPSEAQWEFAARGGKNSHGYQYSGGNNSSQVAWYKQNASSQTHPIGSKEPNELFIYDMSGNVAEWCNDYAGGYVGVPQTDPIGPSEEFLGDEPGWIVRGGSWKHESGGCKSYSRDAWDVGVSYIGFRFVLSGTEGQATVPGPRTGNVLDITTNSAHVTGVLWSDGGNYQTEWGFCYGTSPDLASNGTIIPVTEYGQNHDFSATLPNLQSGTKYYVCAYAKNTIGTGYGAAVEFTTEIEVTTMEAIEITNVTATVGGIVPNTSAPVTDKGVCWGTTSNPSISGAHISTGTGSGTFTTQLTSLRANTTYYVRAYAIIDNITNYGNVISFTTSMPNVPTVKTLSAWCYNGSYGWEWNASGKIINDGGGDIDYNKVGILISTNPIPTWDGSNFGGTYGPWLEWEGGYEGVGLTFSTSWGGLLYNTTYYFRAFAVNSAGVGYGEIITKTTGGPPAATITTNLVTNITRNSAVCGGNVSTSGDVMVRGICWSTSPDPEYGEQDNWMEASGTTGSFSLTMTGLTPNTTYYVRAFAFGYMQGGYGETQVFTTLP